MGLSRREIDDCSGPLPISGNSCSRSQTAFSALPWQSMSAGHTHRGRRATSTGQRRQVREFQHHHHHVTHSIDLSPPTAVAAGETEGLGTSDRPVQQADPRSQGAPFTQWSSTGPVQHGCPFSDGGKQVRQRQGDHRAGRDLLLEGQPVQALKQMEGYAIRLRLLFHAGWKIRSSPISSRMWSRGWTYAATNTLYQHVETGVCGGARNSAQRFLFPLKTTLSGGGSRPWAVPAMTRVRPTVVTSARGK